MSSYETESNVVQEWLKEHSLGHLDQLFEKHDIRTLVQCVQSPDVFDESLSPRDKSNLIKAAESTKSRLVLEKWLKKNKFKLLYEPLLKVGVNSLRDLGKYAENDYGKLQVLHQFQGNVPKLISAKEKLPSDSSKFAQLEKAIFEQLVYEDKYKNKEENDESSSSRELYSSLVYYIVASIVIARSFWKFLLSLEERAYMEDVELPTNTFPSITKSVKFKVGRRGFTKSKLDLNREFEKFSIGVIHYPSCRRVESSLFQIEGNRLGAVFSAQRAGHYEIRLAFNGNNLSKVIMFDVQCGPAHHSQTTLVGPLSKTLVVDSSNCEATTLRIEVKDEFGNSLGEREVPSAVERFSIGLWKRVDSEVKRDDLQVRDDSINPVFYHNDLKETKFVLLSLAFQEGHEGWYTAQINLDGHPIVCQDLSIIVLNHHQQQMVNNLLTLSATGDETRFEAELWTDKGSTKKVYLNLNSKQFVIKDYLLKFIPRRLCTFRFAPATKINLVKYGKVAGQLLLTVGDGHQTSPVLNVEDGLVLVSYYYLTLLKKMGGSESFEAKCDHFYKNLLKYHEAKHHARALLPLTIQRRNIVESSYMETKWFNDADWYRLFEIKFESELGIDYGGVRREWFEVLAKELFSPSFGLFVQTEDGSAAVLPNANLSASINRKLFKFCGKIVGKCLVESANGASYRLLLPTRLAKSFLAQIVGLRVHYDHFASDSPEFYKSKINLILKTCVEEKGSGMEDLTFTEEEYLGDRVKVVDLVPNGSKTPVTEKNKTDYLIALAQYRLCDKFRDQTELFLSGLHSIVPDNLLSMFDESELELLLCGVQEYDLLDWKSHHEVIVEGMLSKRTVEWFWTAVTNFTSEQRAKLLQFSTGSSHLPPGGFSELRPRFQISGNRIANALPTAHTCFNMICLSEHRDYAEFEKSLLVAITEGCEGFGMI